MSGNVPVDDGTRTGAGGGGAAETARLTEAMRREADTLAAGPAPVEALVREGRRLVRRRRTAAGAAAAAVLACLAGGVLLPPLLASPGPAPAAPPASSAAPPSATPAGVRVVRPYEPVEIGQGALMGLLPEGRQNYVVSWGGPEAFRESVEAAKGMVGDSIRPGGLSFGHSSTPEGAVLYTGAFRTETEPARITVTAGGRTWEAGMVRLSGDPGWGVYHVDAGRTGLDTRATVTAYGPDGTVLARNDAGGGARSDDGGGARDDGTDPAR
ncbi:hypothetical protein [Streptomyces barkulensis]|uniref:hypothetical protein n=1 Tax=Streptomyces barkulensis TaxID=1257026 RepID=UPI00118140F5|nr:hypothetical protein [Streptomyces barkulensis]